MSAPEKGGPGREAFEQFVGALRLARLPETAKKYAALPEGFRRLLARQAGLSAEEAELPLDQLPHAARARLHMGNRRLRELAEQADAILTASVLPG